jgi:hypothetical protein
MNRFGKIYAADKRARTDDHQSRANGGLGKFLGENCLEVIFIPH